MGRLPQTQFHKVFLAEQEGNTLVVAPRGDAIGFRDSDVAGELKTLCDLAGSPGILNLIVDLGSSDYFGSTMIGAFNQLGNAFRYIGGRIALCDVSPQMDDMLEIMHLKDVWMIFDTRKIALKAMSKTA
jgi:anti-anti-sigma factor